jgi:pseudaminic acid synthase
MRKTFIIAELSANHNGSKQTAIDSIRAAKQAGADAIKIQTYTADTLTLNCDAPDFRLGKGLWEGETLYSLYQKAYTPWEWHEELFRVAREEGLICFSTPFDKTAVDFLEELNNPIYKVASFEITDIPLIKYIASKHKPIILSTGIAMEEDIILALNTIRDEGCNDITLLKCTSAYPAPIEDANLLTIPDMKSRFGVKVGVSDHTEGAIVPMVAVSLGAEVVEKHFIIDRAIGGPDSAFSMEAQEFESMVRSIRLVESSLGRVNYPKELATIKGREFCRSLYVAEDIKSGGIITERNVRSVRPGGGLHPKFMSAILGKRVNRDLVMGDRLSLDMIQQL